MKEKIIKILFSVSAGFGLTILVMIITGFVAQSLGAKSDDVTIIIGLTEGSFAFGILSYWIYNWLKK